MDSNNISNNMNTLLSKSACEVIKKLYNIDFTGGIVRLATDALSVVHPSEPYFISFSGLEETDKAEKMGSLKTRGRFYCLGQWGWESP